MERVRSWLFSPGDRPDRCRKALSASADQVIWDLEDGVAPESKDAARAAVASLLTEDEALGRQPFVRINDPRSAAGRADVAALRAAGLRRWMIPKADEEGMQAFFAALGEGDAPEVLCLIESARGMRDLMRISAESAFRGANRLRLAFGSLDYSLDLGLRPGEEETELLMARSLLGIVSRAEGWPAPIDGVTTGIGDAERVYAAASSARTLGFGGKMVIHPDQIPHVHQAFAPLPEEVSWAREILSGARGGAARVGGDMVDRPLLERARRILGEVEVNDER